MTTKEIAEKTAEKIFDGHINRCTASFEIKRDIAGHIQTAIDEAVGEYGEHFEVCLIMLEGTLDIIKQLKQSLKDN